MSASKCSKLKRNHEPQASGFTVKFEHFDVISTVDNRTDLGKLFSIYCLQYHWQFWSPFPLRKREKERKKQKTNCATITSFLWSVLLLNIALDKSAGDKSLSYGKILNIPLLRWFLFRHQTDPRRLLSAGRDPESNLWWIASYGNIFASLNRFVEFREMLEERAVCFIDCNCVLNYAALMLRSVVVWTDKVTILSCITLQVPSRKAYTIHITFR